MKSALLIVLVFLSVIFQLKAQQQSKVDSIYVLKGYQLILKDSALIMPNDTLVLLPAGTKYKVKKSPETKTNDFYNSLGEKSEKKWITNQLHDALVVNSQHINDDTVEFESPEQYYKLYLGWEISKISYRQVDIISGNVEDTLQVKSTGIIKSLNTIKSKTKLKVLKKNTIVKIGNSLKADILIDNERLFRALPYIVDAKIYAQPLDSINKKVELIIVTKDQFSMGFTPNFNSIDKFALRVYDRNVFGTGSEISYSMIYEKDTLPEYGKEIYYSINNIAGTFTNLRISYTNIPRTEAVTIEVQKDFITPQTKLGAGLLLSRKTDHWLLTSTDTSLYIPYEGAFSDIWLGYAPQIFTDESRKQLVFSGRYDYEEYFERPIVQSDTNQQFANTDLLLAAITYRKINYIKSKLLVGFGRTEDVPIGQLLSITSGYQFSDLNSEPYVGLGFGIARSNSFGIIGGKLDFGGFINYDSNQLVNGAFSTKLIYYAPLAAIGKFSLRNSIKLSYLKGINLPAYRVINLASEIRGLSGNRFYGQEKLVATAESVAFTPWYFIGFRFAFFGFADIGLLGFDNKLLGKDHRYSAIGVGVRIRNENLVFRTIQLRFAFYNLGPENITKTGFDLNTSEQELFNAIDIGKPKLVRFN
jgi:hypothetical protein